MTEKAYRWIVSGRVQGVYFRYFTREQAIDLGLSGWVRNLSDGSVEIEVKGPTAELDVLRERLEKGPSAARVEKISEEELAEDVELPEVFEIRYRKTEA